MHLKSKLMDNKIIHTSKEEVAGNNYLWIIVPVYDRQDHLNQFLECLTKQTFNKFKLVVVDHGVSDIKVDNKVENIILKGSSHMWWTSAINHGISYTLNHPSTNSRTPLLIINDDVYFEPDYLSTLLNFWDYKDDNIVGSICVDSETKLINAANIYIDKPKARLVHKYKGDSIDTLKGIGIMKSDFLSGRGTLISAKVFFDIGLYNESLLPHYKADYELVYRAKKKGYCVCTCPRAIVYSKLDSYVQMGKDLKSKYNTLFGRKSVSNLRDRFFFSYLCFGFFYGSYYWIVALFRILTSVIFYETALLAKLKILFRKYSE